MDGGGVTGTALRAELAGCRQVASDPAVSRLIDTLAADAWPAPTCGRGFALHLRPGDAGSDAVADDIAVAEAAPAQTPG